MRSIKFRAWNTKQRQMFYGIWDIENTDGNILMQFTGLIDSKGKEVYEGDIVRWQSTHVGASKEMHIDIVEWHGCGFLLYPHIHELDAADMEVIGNIYEHHYLLEDTCSK